MTKEMIVYGDNGVTYKEVELNINDLTDNDDSYLQLFSPSASFTPAQVFNFVQNPVKSVSESIGEVINLVGVVAHVVEVVDQNTGELIKAPRLIMISKNGESFVSVSKTLYSSLKALLSLFKRPEDWGDEGVKLKFKQSQKGEKRFFNLEIITE